MRVTILAVSAALAASAFAVSAATPAVAKAKFSVSATTVSEADFDDSVAIGGQVTPVPSGGSVAIYRKDADQKTYTKLGTAPLDSSGGYIFHPVTFDESGPTTIKVVKAKSAGRAAGSVTRTINVYGDVRVVDLPRKVLAGTVKKRDFYSGDYDFATASGALLFQGKGKSPEAEVRIDLQKRCRSYDAYSGMDSRSPEGSYGYEKTFSTDSKGSVLTETDATAPVRGDDPDHRSLTLTSTAHGKEVRSRYLRIFVEAYDDGAKGTARLGVADATAYCNLVGAGGGFPE